MPKRRPVWPWVVAAGVLGVILLGATIYVVTDKGRIKLTVEGPTLAIKVDGDDVRIEGLGEPITLRSGKHELTVIRGETETETRKFVVRRGHDEALRIEYAPKIEKEKSANAVKTANPIHWPDVPAMAGRTLPAQEQTKPPAPDPEHRELGGMPQLNADRTADPVGAKPRTPTTSPERIPPAGPARRALFVKGAAWTVEGDQLVREGLGFGEVGLGQKDWTDYDLTFEALKSAGPDGFGAQFRSGTGTNYWLLVGGRNNKHYLGGGGMRRVSHEIQSIRGTIRPLEWYSQMANWGAHYFESIPGTIRPLEWYRVAISVRGRRIRIGLDGRMLFDCTDDFSQRGFVALRLYDSGGRFRNIKVTAPDGTVLWEGPPDLGAE